MKGATRCFMKNPECVTRCIAGETIVVPIRNNVGDLDAIYTLNEVGSTIWQLIDGENTLTQIVQAICREYDVTQKKAEQDTLALLDDLSRAGLVRCSTGVEER